ncbi:hypothetical protein QY96_02902 [Bacillus thermotolerans]|uniref:YtkA-like domain-containing protein n=2 Tax=Bacillus thermotolerans TaxID=1221996 RepID=A0A0F5HNU6_BACTR|nr:hypothetical protein QY95_03822 [Bacillus thermotolerans]KKB38775.1 hypothetical protein QY96_02902 [Bacillus thermotolerans]
MLEVEILVPEKISLNQETILKVQVTQGKEYVEDAKEVKFELWKENQKKNSELLLAEHQGNGIYSVNKTFDEKGTYHLQTHVTARSLHTMPTKKLVVGELPKEETQSSGEGS